MLQKMLGSHSCIYTRSEPWIMLHPLHALKSTNISAPYNAQIAQKATHDFFASMPGKSEDFYYKEIAKTYRKFYNAYLSSSGKPIFLDKTPRYFAIFDELQATFPDAHFILLYRNPIAVLCSMLKTWVKGNLESLRDYQVDLEYGIEFFLRDFSDFRNTSLVRYEDLIADPVSHLRSLSSFLEIDYEESCLKYSQKEEEMWIFGDPDTVYTRNTPDPGNLEAWSDSLRDPTVLELSSQYLERLGAKKIIQLGYDFDEIRGVLGKAREALTEPQGVDANLEALLQTPKQRLYHLQSEKIRLANQLDVVRQQLSDKSLLVQEKNSVLETRKARIEELQALLKEKDQLRALNSISNEAMRETQALIETYRTRIGELTRKNEAMRETQSLIETYRTHIDEITRKIDELKLELVESNAIIQEQERLHDAVKQFADIQFSLHPLRKLRAYKKLMRTFVSVKQSA